MHTVQNATLLAPGHGLFAQLVADLRARRNRRAVYRRTFGELAALSNRDLADLGIARADIRQIAQKAALEA